MRDDLDLPIPLLRNGDRIPEIARPSLDLDPVVQELLERRNVEDFVVDRL
jgi:hypothetical protein